MPEAVGVYTSADFSQLAVISEKVMAISHHTINGVATDYDSDDKENSEIGHCYEKDTPQ